MIRVNRMRAGNLYKIGVSRVRGKFLASNGFLKSTFVRIGLTEGNAALGGLHKARLLGEGHRTYGALEVTTLKFPLCDSSQRKYCIQSVSLTY